MSKFPERRRVCDSCFKLVRTLRNGVCVKCFKKKRGDKLEVSGC